MLKRRLGREFSNTPYEIKDIYDISGNLKDIRFTHEGHPIVAIIPADYPFKPPYKLYIDGVLMNHAYFNEHNEAVKAELKRRHGIGCCFMCQSYMCSDNWAPSLTLHKVSSQMIGYRDEIERARGIDYVKTSGILPLFGELVADIINWL